MKRVLIFLAVILLIVGFGTIHSSNLYVEKSGSIFIGIGALYLIIQIIISMKQKGDDK